MELRQDDGQRGQSLVGHHVDGDARAVVADGHRVVRMEGHLDPVVPSGEGLVDAVVDHLVDEVVEPARAGRADVHARSKPDRLEPFEDGDVLCCVSGFSHEKSPANSALAGRLNSTRTERSLSAAAKGSQLPLLRPLCEALRHESLERVTRPSPACSGERLGGGCRGPRSAARRGLREAARVRRRARAARRRRGVARISSALRRELERPDRVLGVHVQRPVAPEPRGPGVPSDLGADRCRPRLDEGRHPRRRPEAARARVATSPPTRSIMPPAPRPATTSSSWAGSTGSA